jgi:dephospho-CoA kinase
MKKIGITGGIGSGKTTVCRIFESMGIPIYFADAEAKKIMVKNPSVKKQIKDLLGENSYHKNGKPNRLYISDKIFNDKDLLTSINEIIHPAVQIDCERWFEQLKSAQKYAYALKEAALLVETGNFKKLDALIVVTCPENIRIQRVIKRDKLSHEKVESKLKNQLSEDQKIAVADYLINNDGSESLIPQVWKIHNSFT